MIESLFAGFSKIGRCCYDVSLSVVLAYWARDRRLHLQSREDLKQQAGSLLAFTLRMNMSPGRQSVCKPGLVRGKEGVGGRLEV